MKKVIVTLYLGMLLMAVTAFQVTAALNNNNAVGIVSNTCYNLTEKNFIKSCATSDWLGRKLFASDPTSYDYFGCSVCVDGDIAFIGAELAGMYGAGAVYVFNNNDTMWTEQQILVASDPCGGDYFGCSVSFDENYAIIGAKLNYGNHFHSGSAYIFQLVGGMWQEKELLVATDGATDDAFGFSVSISGSYAIVGAHGDDDVGENSGSAYIYERNGSTWVQEQKLTASDGAPGDWFGSAVSISGDYAAVGAYKKNSGTGAVYIFKRDGSTWVQEQKLTASDGWDWDEFGRSVSIEDENVIIGAPSDDDYGYFSGSAYIFRKTGSSWIEEQKLTNSGGTEGDLFGRSVCISGEYAFVGANGEDDYIGSAFVFRCDNSTWIDEQKLTGGGMNNFGWSVSTDGTNFLIGAYTESISGVATNCGSAYMYMKDAVDQYPAKPSIDGPSSGTAGVSYDYTFTATDPNDDNVYYYIEWGDGDTEEWIGPFDSGEVITRSHSWTEQGTYPVRAKAKDIEGHESSWGTLTVTMPMNQIIKTFSSIFLRNHQNLFSVIVQQMSR